MELQKDDIAEFGFAELDPSHISYLLYIFCDHKEVIYIGQTRKGLARVGSHTELFDYVTDIYIAPSSKEWIYTHEAYLINKYKPKYNQKYKEDYSVPASEFAASLQALLGKHPKTQEIVDAAQDVGKRIRISSTDKVYLN